jgi:hypothetical protein
MLLEPVPSFKLERKARRQMAKGQVKQSKKNKAKLTTAEKQKKKKEKQAKK